MTVPQNLLQQLRTWHRMPAKDLLQRLDVSRATMMRAIQALGADVVSRGNARRTAYAARRAIRGVAAPILLFQIDEAGRGTEVGSLDAIYPQGCALNLAAPLAWPLDGAMQDGWFDSLPYPLDDMRPQGFLGRNFAKANASVLQVPEDPNDWGEDDVLFALSVLGSDTPGNFIIGEAAYRRFLAAPNTVADFVRDTDVLAHYESQARDALQFGTGGSSAAGEFPKFTARRVIDGAPVHVLVKFSGDDASAGTQRWSDLLVCEHLALQTVAEHLGIQAAISTIYRSGGRTFLEVQRFDRHGMRGRSAVCSWSALNAALIGLAGKSWIAGAAALRQRGWITAEVEDAIQRIWHFGQLIANSDMHDGNLAFRPGLQLAPIYDMLPMLYAPARGVELANRTFAPALPMPAEQAAWHDAAHAALVFWQRAAADPRISAAFRGICADNAILVRQWVTQMAGPGGA